MLGKISFKIVFINSFVVDKFRISRILCQDVRIIVTHIRMISSVEDKMFYDFFMLYMASIIYTCSIIEITFGSFILYP